MVFNYLLDSSHWGFANQVDFPHRIIEHLMYTIITVVLAVIVALPIGLYIGHTNRFAFLALNITNAGRALPTFGLLCLFVTMIGLGLAPVLLALVILAIPPILASTYAGLRAVDPATVDAAKGMGMTPASVLWKVELPIALPLIFSGIRSTVLQVIATATVAAYVGFGGLGRYLVDGLAQSQYDQVVAGAVLVATLAIVVDVVLAGISRLIISPGLKEPTTTKKAQQPRGNQQNASAAAA